MSHPLHQAVADRIAKDIRPGVELLRDPACGGIQHLPLFVGKHKARETRMCCVDALLLSGGCVGCIVEVEESGFLPTKICGKFLQAALATHFIHDSRKEGALPYGEHVRFVHVLDGSVCLKEGGRKERQGGLIQSEIRKLLPVRGLSEYHLVFVNGLDDHTKLGYVSLVVNGESRTTGST